MTMLDDHLRLSLIVLATVAATAALAIVIKPKRYLGHWKQLADHFSTTKVPSRYSFPDQRIYVGYLSQPRLFWFFWQRRYWQLDDGEYALFDIEFDNEGLWLHHKGDTESKCPAMMRIPWPYISLRKEYSNEVVLEVATAYAIDFRMPREVGDRCLQWMNGAHGAA